MAKKYYANIGNDYGEVVVDDELVAAIEMIQDCAWSIQMTPGEFLSIFDNGIPECPNCVKEREKNAKTNQKILKRAAPKSQHNE